MSAGSAESNRSGVYGYFARRRVILALTCYGALGAASYSAAYLLRFEFDVPAQHWEVFLITLPGLVVIRLGSAWWARLSIGRWRFVGTTDIIRLLLSTTMGTGIFFLVTRVLPLETPVPRSVIAIDWVLATYLTAGLWISYRIVFEMLRAHGRGGSGPRRKVLVVGAGEAGSFLVREMIRYPTGFRPVGLVDDDPLKWGTRQYGVEVVGAPRDIGPIAEELEVDEVHIAVPSAEPADLRRIVGFCEGTNLPVKVLPGIAEVLEGKVSLGQLRELQVEDLLGREPVSLSLPELQDDLRDAVVLVTGGAGSIGSELARQIALHHPKGLVLLDQAETPLFYIDGELRSLHPDLALDSIVGSVLDVPLLEDLLRRHGVTRVFHAAAYKHVPLMEGNVRQALRNNVLGTWRTARTAGDVGVERFVLVSTDKAVRPSSVMGATKKLAEKAILAVQQAYPATDFHTVRFGNVLGSSGSVLPTFRRQLEVGGPLTVTDPEVTRYFMTISEAVQLVLQASLLEEARGRVCLLEMGEPVRIVDLARNLVRLSGLRPDEDVEIVFTGLRSGEKLHEELHAEYEESLETGVEKIRILRTGCVEEDGAILDRLRLLDAAAATLDERGSRDWLMRLLDERDRVELGGDRPRLRVHA